MKAASGASERPDSLPSRVRSGERQRVRPCAGASDRPIPRPSGECDHEHRQVEFDAGRARDVAHGRTGPRGQLPRRVPPRSAPLRAVPPRRGHRRSARGRRGDGVGLRRVPRPAAGGRRRRASRRHRSRGLVSVRSFHRFCASEGLLDIDPSEQVGAPRVPQGIPKALDEDEIDAILRSVVGDGPRAQRDRAILEVLYATGVRISELMGLDLADIDLDDGIARVLGKGDKERVVPMGRAARAELGRYCGDGRLALRSSRARRRDSDAVFLNARGTVDPPGLLADRATRGGARRSRRTAVTARVAPFVRDAHARSRCRHPRRAGVVGARERVDDAGVHQGLTRAAACRIRIRPPKGKELMVAEPTGRLWPLGRGEPARCASTLQPHGGGDCGYVS